MNAYQILQRLINNGYKTYFVGGYVRDMLLNIPSQDIDITTQAKPNDIIKLFANDCHIKTVGKSFGVILVDDIEVATFRKDKYFGLNDKKVKITYSDIIEEDLSRRDFTINSMAYDPINKEIIDPFHGQRDIKDKIIRFTGDPYDRINDDPNRIIRGCKFIAKIHGYFHNNTFDAIKEKAHYVHCHIAPERIRLELLKAMKIDNPSLFFKTLHKIGGLQYIFPPLKQCYGLYHGKHHKEDVFTHSMICGDSISPKKPLLRLAGYLHDIGKVMTYKDDNKGNRTFYNHHKAGYNWIMNNLMDKLKFSEKETKYIANLIKVHMRGLKQASPKAIRKLLKSLDEKNIRYQDLLRLKIADRKGNLKKKNYSFKDIRGFVKRYRDIINESKEKPFMKLAINGHDIMKIAHLKPGKEIGLIKKHLFNLVIDNPNYNKRDVLLAEVLRCCVNIFI